jgi:small-conductance mechanosensitive channel
MTQTINNYNFSDVPRIHIKVDVMPGQKYKKSEKVVCYKSLPDIELWRFNVDGWDIFDQVLA